MKISNVALFTLIAFIVGFVLGMIVQKKYRPCINIPVVTVTRDTIVTHDTIINKVPYPVKVEHVRYDTVQLHLTPNGGDTTGYKGVIAPDTIKAGDEVHKGQNGDVIIPITEKVYQTEDYKATVQGWRPALVGMEIYRPTRTITKTVTKVLKPRWSITAGPGVGYWDKKITPFVGVTAGLVLWSK